MATVRVLSPYRATTEPPLVQSVPIGQLRARLCAAACALRAAYVPGEGLYLDDSMHPDRNRLHQSVLFHELVHHAQEASGAYADLDECNRWRLREIEAYALQNRFLSEMGVASRVMDPGGTCPTTKAQTFGAE
ncbi:MAG TPA: hypothetical protein VFB54_20820, partial [Burkholderiales bacterium]|nr:hypothetical protein [Burkholderiales bacterium]